MRCHVRLEDGRPTSLVESWRENTRAAQYGHETLCRSETGLWVLERAADWQGSPTTWEEVAAWRAAAWLALNAHAIPEGLHEQIV